MTATTDETNDEPEQKSAIRSIAIKGFRGFSEEQTLKKSSIIEAITAVSQLSPPTFSEGKRNADAGSRVKITLTDVNGVQRSVSTVPNGGSETAYSGPQTTPNSDHIFVLLSRRTFPPFFGKSENTRTNYIRQSQKLGNTRDGQANFPQRIFHINGDESKRSQFEEALKNVLDPLPNWTIDQSEQGSYYLKYMRGTRSHSSDGLGEGLVSTFFIVDALYDSNPGSMIVIDEPELSLHPQLQANVRDYLIKMSADRQIVVSTHSPKFIDWLAIAAGAAIARVNNLGNGIQINAMGNDTRGKIRSLLTDMNNPHLLGQDANEVFFLNDKVLLVEGQEDVMFLPRALNDLGIELTGSIYGWGVGGADKMSLIASILKDLGFSKVAGLLDNDKRNLLEKFASDHKKFHFCAIPADDVRNNPNRIKPGKTTLLDPGNEKVGQPFRSDTRAVFDGINSYFETG